MTLWQQAAQLKIAETQAWQQYRMLREEALRTPIANDVIDQAHLKWSRAYDDYQRVVETVMATFNQQGEMPKN